MLNLAVLYATNPIPNAQLYGNIYGTSLKYGRGICTMIEEDE